MRHVRVVELVGGGERSSPVIRGSRSSRPSGAAVSGPGTARMSRSPTAVPVRSGLTMRCSSCAGLTPAPSGRSTVTVAARAVASAVDGGVLHRRVAGDGAVEADRDLVAGLDVGRHLQVRCPRPSSTPPGWLTSNATSPASTTPCAEPTTWGRGAPRRSRSGRRGPGSPRSVTKSRSGKTTRLSGNVGTAAAASPGTTSRRADQAGGDEAGDDGPAAASGCPLGAVAVQESPQR